MKAEKKELLVSILNEKITSLKGEVIEKQDAIGQLEEARSELLAGPVKRATISTSKKENEKPNKTGTMRKKATNRKTTKKSESKKEGKGKKGSSGPDLKGQDAPFKSYYKHCFWNKSQGKWNGQVNNPNVDGPAKLTKSSDDIEVCAQFVIEQLGHESVEDIYMEL